MISRSSSPMRPGWESFSNIQVVVSHKGTKKDTKALVFPWCLRLSLWALCETVLAALIPQRSHVNREAVLHIRLRQSIVSFVQLLNRNHFDIGSDVVFAAKVQHLLCFANAPDPRPRQPVAPPNPRTPRHVYCLR